MIMSWTLRISGAAIAAGLLMAAPSAMATKVGAGAVLAVGEIGDEAILGLQGGVYAGLPTVKRLHIGGDVTYYLVDNFTLLTLEPNVHFDFVQMPVLDVYAIGGLNVVYARASLFGFTETEVDVGLLAGIGAEAKAGPLHPFVDLKVALHEDPYFAASGGLRLAF
jgi:hypothetical protein